MQHTHETEGERVATVGHGQDRQANRLRAGCLEPRRRQTRSEKRRTCRTQGCRKRSCPSRPAPFAGWRWASQRPPRRASLGECFRQQADRLSGCERDRGARSAVRARVRAGVTIAGVVSHLRPRRSCSPLGTRHEFYLEIRVGIPTNLGIPTLDPGTGDQ